MWHLRGTRETVSQELTGTEGKGQGLAHLSFWQRANLRSDAEAPILWPPDSKRQLIGKDPDAGKMGGRRKGSGRG